MARKKSANKKENEVVIQGTFDGLTDIFDLFDEETVEEEIVNELEVEKPLDIFSHIKNLTVNKVPWNSLRACDKKTFTPYMISLWLGMVPELVQIIDELQIYSIGTLTPEQYYIILYEYLPQKSFFIKFIKGDKEGKFNKELIELISKHFEVSKSEATDYIEIFNIGIDNQLALRDLIAKYGKTDKEINKLIEIKIK